jgi:hypothetical protein
MSLLLLGFASAFALAIVNSAPPVLYSNGPFITGVGNGQGGADTSLMQSGFSTSGYGCSSASSQRVADDFAVPAGEVWTLEKLRWRAFQTGAPTTGTLTAIQVRLWSTMPTTGGSPLWSSSANVLLTQAWSNCYRVVSLPGDTSRAVIDVVADLGGAPQLAPGTYWVDVQLAGSLSSGPWANPTVPSAGSDNARFFSPSGGWVDVRDVATGAAQDFPFELEGQSGAACALVTSYCTAGTSTNGCVPALSWSGAPSVSASSGFTLQCSAIEGQKLGVFFYGASGALIQPWSASSTSVLCVRLPTQRTAAQSTNGTPGVCDGAFALDFLAYMSANPLALGQPLLAGQRFNAQVWYRDPPAPKTTNLSDALEFLTCP